MHINESTKVEMTTHDGAWRLELTRDDGYMHSLCFASSALPANFDGPGVYELRDVAVPEVLPRLVDLLSTIANRAPGENAKRVDKSPRELEVRDEYL